jgi:hypothetical protein
MTFSMSDYAAALRTPPEKAEQELASTRLLQQVVEHLARLNATMESAEQLAAHNPRQMVG